MTKLRDEYLTSFEAAKRLGFSPDHVRRLVRAGKIRAVKLGHNWLILEKDLKDIKRLRFPQPKE